VKRILAIALVAIFVLGFAVSAFALEVTGKGESIDINGYYFLRGVAQNNVTDWCDSAATECNDHKNFYKQRMRVNLTFNAAEGVKAVTRFDIMETSLGNDTKQGTTSVTEDGANVQFDYAYLQVNGMGGIDWTLGRQVANWGTGFATWGAVKDRIKAMKKIGDVSVGAIIQKDSENNYGGRGGGDVDTYYVLAVIPVGEGKLGFIYGDTHDNNDDVENNATGMDLYYMGKAGPVNLAVEYNSKDRDDFKAPVGGCTTAAVGACQVDAQTGMLIAANMDINDKVNVGIGYASAANGWTADDDFSPTLFFGTNVSPNAIINFGETWNPSPTTNENDDTVSAIVLSGKFKINDDLTAGANIAQATLSDNSEYDLMEIDLYANYKVAANTTLYLGYAMGTPDASTTKADAHTNTAGAFVDDPFTTAAIQIKTNF